MAHKAWPCAQEAGEDMGTCGQQDTTVTCSHTHLAWPRTPTHHQGGVAPCSRVHSRHSPPMASGGLTAWLAAGQQMAAAQLLMRLPAVNPNKGAGNRSPCLQPAPWWSSAKRSPGSWTRPRRASRYGESRWVLWMWEALGLGPLRAALLTCTFFLQNMEMVPVPTKSYGNFYEGDCYVLLSVGLCRDSGCCGVPQTWGHRVHGS